MKKGWKIALISLGSLLGLVVVVVAVAMYLVFTPSRLTKIVNRLASDYIACETHFDRVDLTLLSTFPDAGLKVENVAWNYLSAELSLVYAAEKSDLALEFGL